MAKGRNLKFHVVEIFTYSKADYSPRLELTEQVTHGLLNLFLAKVKEHVATKDDVHFPGRVARDRKRRRRLQQIASPKLNPSFET
jgi:hypothetical protein